MGSYINLGLVSISNRKDFNDKCIALIERLDEFNAISIKYPRNEHYTVWIEECMCEFSLEQAIECCVDYDMAEILCDFRVGKHKLKNVLLRIKKIQDSALCLLLEMPEVNDLFKDIEVAESVIFDFLRNLMDLNFEYAFCDSEANTPENLKQINKDEEYSMFVRYKPCFEVIYASWKINGLLSRK